MTAPMTGGAGGTELGVRSRDSGLNRREIGTILSILKSNRFSSEFLADLMPLEVPV